MQRNPDVLNTRETADYLGAHVETVRRLAKRGDIPSYKVGKDWRFSKDALHRWMATHHERSRSAHILVVDDEEDIREFARRALEPEGYRVSAASSGPEALDLIRQETPDVVVLDLKMPGMNGPAVLKEIRAKHRSLPVIVITGYPDSDMVMEVLRHAPVLMLPKPVDPEPLVEAVHAAHASKAARLI